MHLFYEIKYVPSINVPWQFQVFFLQKVQHGEKRGLIAFLHKKGTEKKERVSKHPPHIGFRPVTSSNVKEI